MSLSLAGRTALITGAATGIGRATAIAFAAAGARVVVNHLGRAEAAAELVAQITVAGGRAWAVEADVTSAPAVAAMIDHAAHTAGQIDVLVNNAGVILEKPFLDTTDAEWDQVLNTDLRSMVLTCRAVLPGMLMRGHGVIVNLASDLGLLGRAQYAAYCTAKAGVIGLTKSLAREFAPAIRINAIAPGPVDTQMLSAASMGAAWRAKELDIPQHRFAAPEEIAATALFLASDLSRFYCGQVLGPNGGSAMP